MRNEMNTDLLRMLMPCDGVSVPNATTCSMVSSRSISKEASAITLEQVAELCLLPAPVLWVAALPRYFATCRVPYLGDVNIERFLMRVGRVDCQVKDGSLKRRQNNVGAEASLCLDN